MFYIHQRVYAVQHATWDGLHQYSVRVCVSGIPYGYYTHIHVARSLTAYSFFFFVLQPLRWLAVCLFIYNICVIKYCVRVVARECAATTVLFWKCRSSKCHGKDLGKRDAHVAVGHSPCVDILDIYREFATLYTKRSSRFMSRGIPIYDAVTLGHCCHSHSAFRIYVVVVLEFYTKRTHFTGGGYLSKKTALTWLVAIKLRGLCIPTTFWTQKEIKEMLYASGINWICYATWRWIIPRSYYPPADVAGNFWHSVTELNWTELTIDIWHWAHLVSGHKNQLRSEKSQIPAQIKENAGRKRINPITDR